jgi:hypothetical protein
MARIYSTVSTTRWAEKYNRISGRYIFISLKDISVKYYFFIPEHPIDEDDRISEQHVQQPFLIDRDIEQHIPEVVDEDVGQSVQQPISDGNIITRNGRPWCHRYNGVIVRIIALLQTFLRINLYVPT